MTHTLKRTLAGLVVAAIALTGCSAQSAPESNAPAYSSLDELAADSEAIVIATVAEQRTESDSSTVSTLTVDHVSENPSLGANTGGPLPDLQVGETISIHVLAPSEATASLDLKPEEQYLVFLGQAPPGTPSTEYVITGGVGLYQRDGDQFTRVVSTADGLPETITATGDESAPQ
jgi:hypothetical protein